ncbi:MAG: sulfite exporter TauE/SafE family protein [Oscillospiraceae bacterium]|nr:sulfite exporter TauE/SafE family protein [Oscillospiraceae bacterium]
MTKEKKHKNLIMCIGGLAVGLVNGLLGAGGGMLAVPLLRKTGLTTKESHSNAVGVILPLSVFSAVLYISAGRVKIMDSVPYIPGGLIGALIGTKLLKKIPAKILKKLFAAFMIWAGIRLLIK